MSEIKQDDTHTACWGMVIDVNRCVGCQTCTIACKHANDTLPGVQWRKVVDVEMGEYPSVERFFMVTGCQHCAEPPCVPVCPTVATWQREDGLVIQDYDVCIGCAYCAVSCPYQARTIAHDQRWYRGRFGQEEVRAATASAVRFLEERGTVAVGDVSNTLAHLGRLAASSLSAVVFLELLAWDPAKAEATLAWGESLVRECAPALRPGLELRLAAHAPHSVSPELLRRLAAKGGPASIHLAESRDEAQFLAEGTGAWPGFLARRGLGHVRFAPAHESPARYADGCGVLHDRLVAAHGVQLDAADRALLSERGVPVVLCPRSNASLGVGTADVPALAAAGVKLALGSDSLASAPTLDVLVQGQRRTGQDGFQRLVPERDKILVSLRQVIIGGIASALVQGVPFHPEHGRDIEEQVAALEASVL